MSAPGRERRRAREKKQHAANRPHGVTIALGILSFLVSVVAGVMSFVSLERTRISTHIGQRPYIYVSTVDFEQASRNDYFDRAFGRSSVEEKQKYRYFDLRYTLHITNGGNTPALSPTVRLRFQPDDGVRFRVVDVRSRTDGNTATIYVSEPIGPKSTVAVPVVFAVELDTAAKTMAELAEINASGENPADPSSLRVLHIFYSIEAGEVFDPKLRFSTFRSCLSIGDMPLQNLPCIIDF